MSPTILDGDYVLAGKYKTNPIDGTIAVIQHPVFGKLIKRIKLTDKTGKVFVTGDNELSTPTETFGALDKNFIKYEVRWRISPFGISRFIPSGVSQLDT